MKRNSIEHDKYKRLKNWKYSKYLRFTGILGILGFTGFLKSYNGEPMYSNFIFFTFFSSFVYFDFREEIDERMMENWEKAGKIALSFVWFCVILMFIFIQANPWHFKIEYVKISNIKAIVFSIFAGYHLINAFSFYYLDKVK